METEAQTKNKATATPCVKDVEQQLITQMNVEPRQPNACTVRKLGIRHKYAERKRAQKKKPDRKYEPVRAVKDI